MNGALITWIIIAVYLVIGICSFFWIKRDSDFRAGPWFPIAISSVFLWPVMILVWMLARGEEHLSTMAAKQSHRDYQIYMRNKKDKDLFAYFKESNPADENNKQPGTTSNETPPDDAASGIGFYDHNIETLIANGDWDEAMSVAKQMRKVAIQTQEEDRIYCYDEYIRRIEDGKRMELD